MQEFQPWTLRSTLLGNMTATPLPKLILTHQRSSHTWGRKTWKVGIWERRETGCFLVGSACYEGSFSSMLRGELQCREMGIHWRLETEGDRLAWRQEDGTLAGHTHIHCAGFKKPAIHIESATNTFTSQGPRTLMTERRRENVCLQIKAPGGWFEICAFPAEVSDPPGPDLISTMRDDLTLWVLKPDKPVIPTPVEEPSVSAEAQREQEVRHAAGIAAKSPPPNAATFFTGQGTVEPPEDPVDQWLLVAAATVCHGIYYP